MTAEAPMRSPLIWFGGCGQATAKLLPLLPPHRSYVEPFAGGASTFFAKPRARLETLNDVHRDLVNFYRVLADPMAFVAFTSRVQAIPHSREIWEEARVALARMEDPIGRAVAFFVMVRQGVSGQTAIQGRNRTGWSRSVGGREGASSAQKWVSAVDRLPAVHARLRGVQIEQLDFRRCLRDYDAPDVLHFLDPPFHPETCQSRRYEHSLSSADHEDLIDLAQDLAGMVVLLGYDHPAYAPLLASGWEVRRFAVHALAASNGSRPDRELCVWRNPAALERARRQLRLEVTD